MAVGFRLVTAVLATLTVWGVFCARPSDHKALRRHLLTNYTPEVRPVINDTQATKVFLSLDLLSIVEVGFREEINNLLLAQLFFFFFSFRFFI